MFLAVFVELSLSHHCNPNRVSVSLAISPAYLAQRMRTWRYSCGLYSCVALQLQRFIPPPSPPPPSSPLLPASPAHLARAHAHMPPLRPLPSSATPFLPPPSRQLRPPRSAHARRAALHPTSLSAPPSSRLLPVSPGHLAQRMRTRRLLIPTPPSTPLLPESRPPTHPGASLAATRGSGGSTGQTGSRPVQVEDTGCAGKAISPRSLSARRSADKVSEERA